MTAAKKKTANWKTFNSVVGVMKIEYSVSEFNKMENCASVDITLLRCNRQQTQLRQQRRAREFHSLENINFYEVSTRSLLFFDSSTWSRAEGVYSRLFHFV